MSQPLAKIWRFMSRMLVVGAAVVALIVLGIVGRITFQVLQPTRPAANIAIGEADLGYAGAHGAGLRSEGFALREALDAEFMRLRDLQIAAVEKPLTNVATRFIAIGSSIDDAKTVLHFAGFHLSTSNDRSRPTIDASVDHYLEGGLILNDTILSIQLVPSGRFNEAQVLSGDGPTTVGGLTSSVTKLYL